LGEMLDQAIRLYQSGRLTEAMEIADRLLLKNSEDSGVLHLKGAIAMNKGEKETALELMEKAVKLAPKNSHILDSYAMALRDNKRYDEAVKIHHQALKIERENPFFINNLGLTFKEMERYEEAKAMFKKAMALNKNYEDPWINLGMIAAIERKGLDAIKSFEKAIVLNPRSFAAHYNIAHAFKNNVQVDKMLFHASLATELNPYHYAAWRIYAEAAYAANNFAATMKIFGQAIKRFPDDPWFYYFRAVQQPHLANSNAEIDDNIKNLNLAIQALPGDLVNTKPLEEINIVPFFQAYQGRNMKPFMEGFSSVLRLVIPDLNFTTDHVLHPIRKSGDKIKVGIITQYLRNHFLTHTQMALWRALYADKRFELMIIYTGTENDKDGETEKIICEFSGRIYSCKRIFTEDREVIAAMQLDVVIYPELGLGAQTFMHAHCRYAPVQVVLAAGHPVTSGIKTIDYAITTMDLEPPNYPEHYSETPVFLTSMPFSHDRPETPTSPLKSRAELGLPEGRLYAVPVVPSRLHPDLDYIFTEIMKRDLGAKIIIFGNEMSQYSDFLRNRFEKNIPHDLRSRIHFIPSKLGDDFYHALKNIDVVMDSLYFGLGSTNYKCFAWEIPVVTYQSEFMRGRITHYMYKKMGIEEMYNVATKDEYIEMALKMGSDRDFHNMITRKIRENSHKIFNLEDFVPEIIEWLIGKTFPKEKNI